MEHDASTYNQERDILVSTYILGSSQWQLITHIVNKGIDSRLNKIDWFMENTTDKYDRILHQERVSFYVKDTNSLAVLLYRLDELPENEEAEQEFHILADTFLGMEEPMILDAPWIRRCPNCELDDPELQDGLYSCGECGWTRDFKSSWPYLHWYKDNEYHYQMRWARLDLAVSMLFKRNDDNE